MKYLLLVFLLITSLHGSVLTDTIMSIFINPIIDNISIVFIALLSVALAIFGVKKILNILNDNAEAKYHEDFNENYDENSPLYAESTYLSQEQIIDNHHEDLFYKNHELNVKRDERNKKGNDDDCPF